MKTLKRLIINLKKNYQDSLDKTYKPGQKVKISNGFNLENAIYALTLAVTIIIVCVPEGLPMMVTLVLSSNMKRMLKSNVLVRKMMGIETSGSINMLFTDKTGTLTKGKLEVIRFLSSNMKEYDSEYEISKNDKSYDLVRKSFILNNESVYSDNKIIGGNITDRALLSFLENKNINDKVINKIENIFYDVSKVNLEIDNPILKTSENHLLRPCFQ